MALLTSKLTYIVALASAFFLRGLAGESLTIHVHITLSNTKCLG